MNRFAYLENALGRVITTYDNSANSKPFVRATQVALNGVVASLPQQSAKISVDKNGINIVNQTRNLINSVDSVVTAQQDEILSAKQEVEIVSELYDKILSLYRLTTAHIKEINGDYNKTKDAADSFIQETELIAAKQKFKTTLGLQELNDLKKQLEEADKNRSVIAPQPPKNIPATPILQSKPPRKGWLEDFTPVTQLKTPSTPDQNKSRNATRSEESTRQLDPKFDDPVVKILKKYEKALNKLPKSIPDTSKYMLVRAPIWLTTKPMLIEVKLKSTKISYDRIGANGYILDNQILVAVNFKTAKAKTTKTEEGYADIIKGIIRSMKMNGTLMMDVMDGKTFAGEVGSKVVYTWLLPTRIYADLGNFIVNQIGFPITKNLQTDQADNIDFADKKRQDSKKEFGLTTELSKQRKEFTEKRDAINADLVKKKTDLVAELTENFAAYKEMSLNDKALEDEVESLRSQVTTAKNNKERAKLQAVLDKKDLEWTKNNEKCRMFYENKIKNTKTKIGEYAKQIQDNIEKLREEIRSAK